MMKKAKQVAAPAGAESPLAQTVRDSAQQIWLAGLGAFSKAQEEGGKVFEALVKEGEILHRKTRGIAESKVAEVTGQVSKAASRAQSAATETWDKFEQVFEDRVARSLHRLGVPTAREVEALTRRIEELSTSVDDLGGAKTAPRKGAAKKAALKKAANRRAV